MKNFLIKHKEVLLLSVITFILSLTGLWMTGILTNSIYPVTADDDTYYLARMNTVHNGYSNIGNPYYLEHINDKAPAFTLPDIVAASPFFLGLNLNQVIVFNFIFWSQVFCLLLWLILIKFNLSKKLVLLGTLFVYLEVYGTIMRPVILQVIWPVLLLFILGFIFFEKEGRERLGLGLMILSTAVSFYCYSYLSQFLVVALFILILYYLWKGDNKKAYRVFLSGCIALLLVIPELVGQYKNFLNPIYWQTFSRFGLVESHWTTIYQYNYGRWLLLAMPVWYLLGRKIKEEDLHNFFVYLFGISLIVTMWSNVFTGKEYFLGTHIGLFVNFYIAVVWVLILNLLFKNYGEILKINWWLKITISILLIGLFANLVSNLQRSLPYREVFRKDLIQYENVKGVISWINASPEDSKVLLSDDNLSMYIGMYTNNYSLFAKSGQLGMMESNEVVDRYLVSRAMQKTLSKEQLINEMTIYAGLGDGRRLESLNKKNRDCRNYRLDVFFGMFCETEKSLVDYMGNMYWDDLLAGWSLAKKNIVSKLSQYQVTYIAWPRNRMEEVDFSKLLLRVVYEDEYYIVHEIIKK